jgi:hypothetical protein
MQAKKALLDLGVDAPNAQIVAELPPLNKRLVVATLAAAVVEKPSRLPLL